MIISFENLTKYYGSDLVLSEINAEINDGERIGLVGVNGAGKTTLLNIIGGIIDFDSGELTVGNGVRIGYLRQNSGINMESTIRKEMMSVFDDLRQMEAEMKQLQEKMAQIDVNSDEYIELSHRYSHINAVFEQRDGYILDVKIDTILNGMGFGDYDKDGDTSTLSGGEKTRLALAKLLLSQPNLLILDEPTNHLDFKTLMWLEDYLISYKGSLLIVSHDRYFLDKTVTRIWEVENYELECYRGNYSKYVELKREKIKREIKEYEIQQRQISDMQTFVDKNIVRASTTKSAQSRRKALEKMEIKRKPSVWDKRASFSFEYDRPPVKDVLHLKDMTLQVGDEGNKITLSHVEAFDVMRGEKIAFIGPNGIGKSSLLKAIQSIITCPHKQMDWGRNVKIGYYEQENRQLHPEKTIIEEVGDRFPRMPEQEIRSALGRMLFSGEDVFKTVGSLSGGEKARVAFSLLMLERANVLLLDEPTNHIDIVTKEMLEDALKQFDGTVIMVSHDRYMLNKIPDTIIEMGKGGMDIYKGNFNFYLENKKDDADEKQDYKKDEEPKQAADKYFRSKKERAKQVADKKRMEQLLSLIDENENTIASIEAEMASGKYSNDYTKLEEMCAQIAEIKNKNEAYTEEWLALTDELEGFN